MRLFFVGHAQSFTPFTLTNVTGIDATHIFDGLNKFPTHVAHMRLGSFVMNPTPWPPSSVDPPLCDKDGPPSPTLFQTALEWLREDREYRRELEKGGRKTRGARRGQVRTPLAAVASIGVGG